MPSTMVFDMADSGVKQMVDGWEDNTEYTATVRVKTGAGPQRNVSEVLEFTPDEGAAEPAEEENETMKEDSEDKMATHGVSKPSKPPMPSKPKVEPSY